MQKNMLIKTCPVQVRSSRKNEWKEGIPMAERKSKPTAVKKLEGKMGKCLIWMGKRPL